MIRFVLVGIVNTLVGTGVMFGLYNLAGCTYWVSSAANYIVGSIVSYFLNKNFTFRDKSSSWKTVVGFILNISICYFIAYGLAKPAVRMILAGQTRSVQENIAMLVGMGLFVCLNYIGQRFFIFNRKDNEK